jgi:chromosome segregation protein
MLIIPEKTRSIAMRFKSIEINGFKSFAERTKVYFQPGITAIVGPNGCGKSNVSDAIRWVLGEQSAKQIRGERMEDVIFSGTKSRAPMGMAEVTLVVTDLNAGLASEFAAFEEIQITRRFYRSGESEYLINRIPCRLSDIRELFMDTGLGPKAYSIIGQDNISAILNAKPKERRFLFEEAAGISKYKARKDEALRKLERTRENLSRVRDIIAEVTRQKNSLNRQAKKAERYKQYKSEIQTVDVHLCSIDFRSLNQDWETLEEKYEGCRKKETELLTQTTAKESRIEDLELEVLDREKELDALHDEIRGLESKIAKEENRIEILQGEVSHLNTLSEGSTSEIKRLEEEIASTEGSTVRIQGEYDAIAATNDEREQGLELKEETLREKLASQADLERQLDWEKSRLGDLMRQIGIQKNRLENMDRERDSLLELNDGFDINRTEMLERLSQTRQQLSEKSDSLEKTKSMVEQKRSSLVSLRLSLEEKQETFSSMMEQFSTLRERIGHERSRLATLVELQDNLEGYDEGVRSLVEQTKSGLGSGSLPKIYSVVADIFETDPRYEVAIESAINRQYQSLVVNSPEDSINAIEHLKRHESGRGSFIPLNPKTAGRTPFVLREDTGAIGEAVNLVRFDRRFQGVADYLLGDVVIMESLEKALALYRSNGFRRTLVTLNGEVLDPSGTVEGGTWKKNTSGFIRRKREIRELKISIQILERELSTIEEGRDRLNREISQLKEELNEKSVRLESQESLRVDLEKEAAFLNREEEHLQQGIETLEIEHHNRSSEIVVLESSLAACRNESGDLEDEVNTKEQTLSALMDQISALREKVEEKRRAITEERIQMASIREKCTSLLSHIDNNRRTVGNLRDLISARYREVEDAKAGIARFEEEKKETVQRIDALISEKEAAQRRLAQEQNEFETKRILLHEEKAAFKQLRREIDELNRLVNDLEVRRTELSIKIDHLLSRVQEKYSLSLKEVVGNYIEKEIDVAAAQERLAELKQKIERMGPVNIMAIEEYNALEERFQFLTTQETDLQEAVDSLMATIRKINRTSRKRFQEAFQAINEKFRTVFSDLFQGGQAELKLEDGADILEAGVEIVAQPPGKKLQHLSLLSGGEKALTAVALIFAGFLVKPSPFCLLDEVDAPLDDANVERYNQVLAPMTKDTQYIVITHNKTTMEHSDALYGITMQEPGISKMVSVKFNDGHEAQLSA